jgi:4Fe-4S ferredoxin
MLPRTNCKLCGCLTCYAFAFELVSRKKKLTECPRLLDEDLRPTLEFLQEALGRGEKVEGTDFVIDKQKCAGCGICDIVCQKASTTVFSAGRTFKRQPVPPVFQIVDGVVKVVNWSSCRRASGDTLCKVCVEKCPFGTLELVK